MFNSYDQNGFYYATFANDNGRSLEGNLPVISDGKWLQIDDQESPTAWIEVDLMVKTNLEDQERIQREKVALEKIYQSHQSDQIDQNFIEEFNLSRSLIDTDKLNGAPKIGESDLVKAKEVGHWLNVTHWGEYHSKKAEIEAGSEVSISVDHGVPCPHSYKDLYDEREAFLNSLGV